MLVGIGICRQIHAQPSYRRTPRYSLSMGSSFFRPGHASRIYAQWHCWRSYSDSQPSYNRPSSVGFRSRSWFLAAYLQVTWVIRKAVGCHYFPPGLQLPPQPLRGLLPVFLHGEQRHNGCEQFASRLRFSRNSRLYYSFLVTKISAKFDRVTPMQRGRQMQVG